MENKSSTVWKIDNFFYLTNRIYVKSILADSKGPKMLFSQSNNFMISRKILSDEKILEFPHCVKLLLGFSEVVTNQIFVNVLSKTGSNLGQTNGSF